MLPAEIITEITTNLAGLQLESNITAQILAAVLAHCFGARAPSWRIFREPPSARASAPVGRERAHPHVGGRRPSAAPREPQKHASAPAPRSELIQMRP